MFKLISSSKSVAAHLVALLLTLFALPAFAGSASLAWNASASTAVTGYKVHYGTASGAYSTHLDAGNVLSLTVPNLTAGAKYYFAVTAYNSAGESGYSNEASATIPVAATAPLASFTVKPTNLTAAFTSTSSGTDPRTYLWEFGDSTTSTTQNPTHAYSAAGTYTVSLTVTNSAGSNKTSKAIAVTAAPQLSADFAATPTSGNVPLTTKFTATNVSAGLSTFKWDFGDGTQTSGATVSHTYTASGNYTVTLTASGTAGSAPTVTKTNFIQTSNALKAAFAANRTLGVAPMRVAFDDQSSGTINSYTWNFGDGSTGTDSNPVHTYRKPGTYVATLTVKGPAGTSVSQNMTIDVKAANDLVVAYDDAIVQYVNDATAPTTLVNVGAKQIAAVDIDRNGQSRVLVDHGRGRPRTGLWMYKSDGTTQQFESRSAVSLAVADIDGNGIDDVIADFGSDGIWWIRDTWDARRIGDGNAKQLLVIDKDHDGNDQLVASFADSRGIQVFSFQSLTWASFDARVPVWMTKADINHSGHQDLVIDFGPGTGIWAWLDNSSWKQLDTNSGVRGVTADFDQYNVDDLVVDFGAGQSKSGLWGYYNGNTWSKINNSTSAKLTAADLNADGRQNVVADFGGGKGIWAWQAGTPWKNVCKDGRTANSISAGQFK